MSNAIWHRSCFSRAFSRGGFIANGCCPRGGNDEALRRQKLDEALRQMRFRRRLHWKFVSQLRNTLLLRLASRRKVKVAAASKLTNMVKEVTANAHKTTTINEGR